MIPRSGFLQRVVTAVVGASLDALLFTTGLPHRHQGGPVSSQQHRPCKICQLKHTFSVSPPATPPLHVVPLQVSASVNRQQDALRLVLS